MKSSLTCLEALGKASAGPGGDPLVDWNLV
jgi:hypothetical protein